MRETPSFNYSDDTPSRAREALFEDTEQIEDSLPENGIATELTGEQLDKARDFFDEVMGGILEQGEPFQGDVFDSLSYVQYRLAEIAGEVALWEGDRIITPSFRQATEVFLNAMISHFQDLKRIGAGSKQIEDEAMKVYENLLSCPPNIINTVGLNEQIRLLSNATRIPELQGYVGANSVGEIVYSLSFMRDRTWDEEMSKQIMGEQVESQLEYLHIFASLIQKAAANGNWAESALQHIAVILESLIENSAYPLVRYSAAVENERLKREVEEPSHSVLQRLGAREFGRASENDPSVILEHEYIDDCIRSDIRPERGSHFVHVSADYIGIHDQSGLLQLLGKCNLATAEKGWVVKMESPEDIFRDPAIVPFLSNTESKDVVLLFQELHHPDTRHFIENKLSVRMRELPLRNQLHLLRYIATQDDGVFGRLERVAEAAGRDRQILLQSFLACAENREMGIHILEFAEQAKPENVRKVLAKYNELTAVIEDVQTYIAATFANQKAVDTMLAVQEMVKRVNKMLLECIRADSVEKTADALRGLEEVRSDVVMFASIFRAYALNNKNPDFRELRKANFEMISGEDLAEVKYDEQRKEMEDIFINNRKGVYPKQLLSKTTLDFQEILKRGTGRFYVLRLGAKTVAFVRFEDSGPGRVYFGSFNVREEGRGSAVGSAMLRTVLEEEGRFNIVEAVVYENNPVLRSYIEDFGFIKIDEDPDYHGTGQKFCIIERPPTEQSTEMNMAA